MYPRKKNRTLNRKSIFKNRQKLNKSNWKKNDDDYKNQALIWEKRQIFFNFLHGSASTEKLEKFWRISLFCFWLMALLQSSMRRQKEGNGRKFRPIEPSKSVLSQFFKHVYRGQTNSYLALG